MTSEQLIRKPAGAWVSRETIDGIGKWLSAALDDENACAEFKADIEAWFEATTQPTEGEGRG